MKQINNRDALMADLWVAIACAALVVGYSITVIHLLSVLKKNKSVWGQETTQGVKNVIKRLGFYPIAYFLQWFAYALLKTKLIEATYEHVIWVVITANIGGILNFLIYYPLLLSQVRNGQFRNNRASSTTSTHEQQTLKRKQSVSN